MLDPQLTDKVVLITGANHGIGAATAWAFAAQGAKVFISYFREATIYSDEELAAAKTGAIGGDKLYRAFQQQTADKLVEEIRSAGGQAAAMEADLGDVASIPALFDACEAALGPVDVLINNHAVCVLETFDPSLTSNEGNNHLSALGRCDRLALHRQHARRRANDGRICQTLSGPRRNLGPHHQH